MDDVEQILEAIRDRVRALLAVAHAAIERGAPIERVMELYVRQAFELEAEADAQAILASSGDTDAMNALRRRLTEVGALRDQFDAEFGDDS